MILPALIPAYLIAITTGLTAACLVTLLFPNATFYIPALTTYGKTANDVRYQPNLLLKAIAVPKRWFTHFYLLAVVCVNGWLLICFVMFTYKIQLSSVNPKFPQYLMMMTSNDPQFNWTTTVLALSLMNFHVLRRCYESLFVSIYSDTTMNVGHYIMGMVHYFLLPLTVVCESIPMVRDLKVDRLLLTELNYSQALGVLLFFYCNYQQNTIVHIMANSRTTPRGVAPVYVHTILQGGWFNLVSCPHFLFEIGIYCSFYLVLPHGYVVKFVLGFVVVNQIFAACINHVWYKKKFSNYPSHRKAIIPYLL